MKKWGLLSVALGCAMGCGFNTQVDPKPTPPSFGGTGVGGNVFDGEAVSAAIPPTPIQGGTLFASRVHPRLAFASNPDAHTVDVVDWVAGAVVWSVDVGEGSEPGRIAEDAQGRAYVALRRGGAVAVLDPKQKTLAKKDVCPAPRGVEIADDNLLVACQGGELVTLSLTSGQTSTQMLDPDLRDVVMSSSGDTFVSRFRAGELLTLDGARARPMLAPDHVTKPGQQGYVEYARYEPEVAWRTVSGDDGNLYTVHQYATTRTVPTKRDPSVPVPYYGGASAAGNCPSGQVVFTAVTRFTNGQPNGTLLLPFQAPAVDVAVAKGKIALAIPGITAHPDTNVSTTTHQYAQVHDVIVLSTDDFALATNAPLCENKGFETTSAGVGLPIGVAFSATGEILVQTREPSMLVHAATPINRYTGSYNSQPTNKTTVPIAPSNQTTAPFANAQASAYARVELSPTQHDTGFSIFHTPTTSTIACMSCHPEGGDDGHVWRFDIGVRRTQSVSGGLLATAPFHWAGDEKDIAHLASDVFTTRMGGQEITGAQSVVLGKWLNALPAAKAFTADDAAVARGSQVWARAECGTCHSGPHLTNNENRDVGTGGALQVPSLLGVAARAPFMHDGCAKTLEDRFNPACGGDKHGNMSGVSRADVADLVAYLKTL